MSVSRKVLRKMKKVMGVISAIPVLTSCSSQISCAKVDVKFDSSTGTLRFSGNGVIDKSWQECYNKNSVRCVVIVNGIKRIGEEAFSGCKSLQEINIPNSVNSIGNYAFFNCRSLQEINIPNSVDTIGVSTFENCTSLKKAIIPNSVKTIGEYAFEYCTSLQEINIPNSVTSIGRKTFCYCESLRKINISNSVNIIGGYAFYGCKSLGEINIPNSVTSIGEGAFECCKSLKEVTIPNSVQFIDEFTFSSSGLERVKFEDMSRRNSKSCWAVWLRKNAFYRCKQLRILDLGNNTNMSRIVKVEKDAFFGNDTNMSRIVKVEEDAFWGCDPKFRALEGSTVRGKFYNTVLNYRYNYFIPNTFLFDNINDRINKKNSFFKKG